MSRTERDTTRIVRSWLEEGADRIPDRVLDAVENRLPATHQRRAGWLARRFPIMNTTTFRYGIAAAAIVIVALLGFNYLSPNIGGTRTEPTARPTPTPDPTTTPSFAPLGSQDLDPGRYAIAGSRAGVSVAVTETGWSSSDGWVVIGPRGNQEPDGMAIRFFTATRLFQNPASATDGWVEVGTSVEDLVNAILDHPAYEASGPTSITIDGRPGQLVELTIPADAEMTEDGRFLLFGDGNGQVWGWARGQTFDLYIVDVAGERLIFDAFHYPGTSQEDLASQRAVVESIRFAS